MEVYSYRENDGFEIEREIDSLSKAEKKQLDKALKQIRLEHASETVRCHMRWFDTAIVPILKNFAEMSSSELLIDKKADSLAIAVLKNPYGFDIMDTDKWWRTALTAAGHVGIDAEEGEVVLTLTFDCKA